VVAVSAVVIAVGAVVVVMSLSFAVSSADVVEVDVVLPLFTSGMQSSEHHVTTTVSL
jgi:hypothetical protein